MKQLIASMLVLVCSGCGPQCHNTPVTNNALRWTRFMECVAALPAAPAHAVGTDWDEVVEACDNAARQSSTEWTEVCSK